MFTNCIEYEGSLYKIEGQYLMINNHKIPLSELYDYTYEDNDINGAGKAILIIKRKKASNIIISSTEFTLIRTSNSIARAEYRRGQILSILNIVYPYIMKNFIQDKIKLLHEEKTFKLCKMRFSKNGITMRPRVYFWLTEVSIPYKYAFVETIRRNIGLTGIKGHYPEFRLRDYRTNEVHKYSTSSSYQPIPSEILKAKELINYIVENKLF